VTTTARSAPTRPKIRLTALWFGLFGAPAAWSLQELVGYATVAHVCYPSWQPQRSSAMPGHSAINVIASLLMLATAPLATLVAYRAWTRTGRHTRPIPQHPLDHAEGPARFMALGGIILGLIFSFTIVMNALALLLQPGCT
jgi:TRAP-type C4-dicarboxylate transport system permease small subunit